MTQATQLPKILMIGFILSAVVLSACGKNQKAKPEASPAAANTSANADRSYALTDEAEAGLTLLTAHDSYGKFNEAAQLNPENDRAKFWIGFLKPVLEMKGFFKRIKPLYARIDDGQKLYEDIRTRHSVQPNAAFLYDGPEDISTPEELNEYIDRLRLSLYDFRQTLRTYRNKELTINLPPEFSKTSSSSTRASCKEVSFGPIRYQNPDPACTGEGLTAAGLNRADFESLLVAASAMQLYFEIWTAYRLNPVAVLELTKHVRAKDVTAGTTRTVLKKLLEIQDAGKVTRKLPFQVFEDTVNDANLALRYVLQNQKTVCPYGYSTPENRRGFLFAMGYCKGSVRDGLSEMEHVVESLDEISAGKPIKIKENEERPAFYIRPLEFNRNPVQSLKEFGPVRINACGRLTRVNLIPLQRFYTGVDLQDVTKMSPAACERSGPEIEVELE